MSSAISAMEVEQNPERPLRPVRFAKDQVKLKLYRGQCSVNLLTSPHAAIAAVKERSLISHAKNAWAMAEYMKKRL